MVNHGHFRQPRWIVHFLGVALLVVNHIRYVGHGGNHIHVELTVESFLHNLHVEQTQESASEAKAQCDGRFRRKCQRCIVELQLFERSPQVFIIRRVDGIYTGKDHGFYLLKALDGLSARLGHMGNGIAHLHLLAVFDAADDITHITCRE